MTSKEIDLNGGRLDGNKFSSDLFDNFNCNNNLCHTSATSVPTDQFMFLQIFG